MNQDTKSEFVLSFTIPNLKLGIFLNLIERVIRAVEVTPLPGSPDIVQGVINLGGQVLPIVNFRKRLNLKERDPLPTDIIIIVKSPNMMFGFFADEILGLKSIDSSNFSKSGDLIPGSNELIEGIAIIDKEMILIHNISRFLTPGEENKLQKAMNKTKHQEKNDSE